MVAKLYLIGDERFEMEKAFAEIVELELFDNFKTAISTAYKEANEFENVLLSPACTSYDMFKNFEERGDTFKKIVLELSDEI